MSDQADQLTAFTPSASDSDPPIILHVDCDCFYAACERLRRPELKQEPVVIGMGYEQADPHGAVATASYEARAYGLESAMPIEDALEQLPRMVDADSEDPERPDPDEAGYYLPVDMAYYQSIGTDVHATLKQYAEPLEPISIDEAYLDVTETTSWDRVTAFADTLKQEIVTTVGIPVSIGVAPTKSAAKVASDHDKPDGLVVVKPGEVQSFFAPLDVEAVHGIGPVTAQQLHDLGIETAGDLATTDTETIETALGDRGRELQQRARGHDPRPVSVPEAAKSISKETSLGRDPVVDATVKQETVRELAQQVFQRAVEKDALYRTIGIKIVEPPFDVHTRERSLSGPIQDRELLEGVAIDLLDEFGKTRVRKLGVRVSNLSFSDQDQPSLSAWEATDPSRSAQPRPTHIEQRLTTTGTQTTLNDF